MRYNSDVKIKGIGSQLIDTATHGRRENSTKTPENTFTKAFDLQHNNDNDTGIR